MTMRLNNLQTRPGSKHRRKRVGCGESSGHGKTSGRGGKGQTARSGGTVRLGFEGGQMPLYRRMPKRGFHNTAFGTAWAVINVGELNDFEDGVTVTPEALQERGLVPRKTDGVKVLGDGDLKKKLIVAAQRFSASARKKITGAGGQCQDLPLLTVHHQKPVPAAAPGAGQPSTGK